MGSIGIPNLRKFLIDNDKVAAACTNIVYYIVNPAMKGKSKYVMNFRNHGFSLTPVQTYGSRRDYSADGQRTS